MIALITFALIHLAILATWLFYFALFIALGLTVRRSCVSKDPEPADYFVCFWVGFACITAFLQVWHLFFQISWICTAILAFFSAGMLRTNLHVRSDWAKVFDVRRWNFKLVFVLAVAGLWVANHATGALTYFDTGMYHLPFVRWATAYPIVPGLGNIHDRLAFNNSHLLFAAFTDSWPWEQLSQHIATGLLIFVVLAQTLTSAFQRTASRLFELIFLPVTLFLTLSNTITSFSSDVPPALLGIVTASLLYRTSIDNSISREEGQWRCFVQCMLAALAVTQKPSALVFSMSVCLVAFYLHITNTAAQRRGAGFWLRSFALPAALLSIWAFRGIILSGDLLYPTGLRVAVPWTVPAEMAEAQAQWVVACARHDYALSPGWSWLRNWASVELNWPGKFSSHMQSGILSLAFPGLIGMGFIAFSIIRRFTRQAKSMGNPSLLYIPCVAGFLFWLFTAPASRFAYHILWIFLALTSASSLNSFSPKIQQWLIGSVLTASIVIGLIFPIPTSWRRSDRLFVRGLIERCFILPTPSGHLPPLATPELNTVTTDFGLALYTPAVGRQCFGAPLPCTQHIATNIREFRLFDGRPGYITVGRWRQMYFPNPVTEYRRGETPRFVSKIPSDEERLNETLFRVD